MIRADATKLTPDMPLVTLLDEGVARLDERGKPLTTDSRTISQKINDASPSGTVAINGQGRVIYVNSAFEKMTGLARTKLIGCHADEFDAMMLGLSDPAQPVIGCPRSVKECGSAKHLPPDIQVPIRFCAQQDFGDDCACTLALMRPKVTFLRRSMVGMFDPVEGPTRVYFFQEVTHEKQVERLKREFVINTTHELRTPLALIVGYAEMLLLKELDAATQASMLRVLHLHGTRLSAQLEQMLDLGRLEERIQNTLPLQALDLGQLLMQVCSEFEHSKDLRRPILVMGDGNYRCQGDRDLLRKCVTELLSNAYRYSYGKGEITVSLHASDDGGCGFTVEDQGIGMTEEEASRVFDSFWRADKTGKHPGAGLGMAIVKRIVILHRGQIKVVSEPSRGTRIEVRLPFPP